MTTFHTFTGDLRPIVGAGATSIKAAIGTNLPDDVALVDLDNQTVYLPRRAAVDLASDATFSEQMVGTNSTGINVLDGNLRYTLYVSYRDADGKRRDWDSGPFELIAAADLSAVAGTGIAVDVDSSAALVGTLVEQAVQDHTPGMSLGAPKRITNFTTTNVTNTSTTGNINELQKTIVGQGRPVKLTFYAPGVWHSVANTVVSVAIIRDANIIGSDTQVGTAKSSSTTTGEPLVIIRETDPLVAGTSYTFTVRVWGAAAGTSTLVAASYLPIQLMIESK